MSFRLRVVGLLVFVAVAATAATAWLTWRQATGAVERTVTASQEETARIAARLREYGYAHGTWDRVSPLVGELARETGQRIRITAQNDALIADSDTLAGRAPRPVSGRPPVLVDPSPRVVLPADGLPFALVKLTATAVHDYRGTLRHTACLTRAGVTPTVRPDELGVPRVENGGGTASCRRPDTGVPPAGDMRAVLTCEREKLIHACLQRVFRERVQQIAPPRLALHLGVRDESPPALAAAPTVGVAAGVAFAVALAALLLSRTVLRPVRALTVATRSLGEGDLARRVPAGGRDEIAELGRAFNRMADSIQAGEERQRRLTGDIAHELRTPLANLRGYVEALQDGYVEATPDLLESLHEEVMLQQRIVDDLQDLALAEAGALTYHRAPVDLRDLLETCRSAHRARAEGAGLALVVEAPVADVPVLVNADADRLRQVVGNLVGNAIRATDRGGSVTLLLVPHGELAIVCVRDTGSGIPADDLPHLFDRFWRADAARGRQTGGSGLGLSIVRQIVRDHGGTVDVESTVGVGTTFTVTLDRI
ncbi:sensor histidine kinase [Streptomyces yaizuensis]|uniref:histidine kinase n=1 Tax=Streptomyces yaizuensis TaxID=2989713 RepID=A0ABQ5P3T7_9ACTN|nr:ATP-binding protein [Streptomyces sp. YSPA8]GLF97242.1 HAMP domain-containing protein [Streptomyces sp. YSPA8]